jgi:hypothetical protein
MDLEMGLAMDLVMAMVMDLGQQPCYLGMWYLANQPWLE